jgi:tetratricopeptide (TPR) repeat protein
MSKYTDTTGADQPINQPEIPSIAPVPFTRPEPSRGTAIPPKSKRMGWTALIVLTGLVIVGLSFLVGRQTAPPNTPHVATPAEIPVVADQKVTEQGPTPEQVASRETFWRLQAQLTHYGADQWDGPAFRQIEALAEEADRLWQSRTYPQAQAAYAQGIDRIESLLTQLPVIVETSLQAGRQALADGNLPAAKQQFQTVLKIEPASAAARAGLETVALAQKRAALIAAAQAHVAVDRPGLALAAYQEALALDPDDRAVQKAIQALQDQLLAADIRNRLQKGWALVDQGDYEGARSVFQGILVANPDHTEARDALGQVDALIRQQRLQKIAQLAAKAEADEQWDEALSLHQKALAIDPHLQFALEGQVRARQQRQIAQRMAFYLKDPTLLENDKHLANAQQLLQQARSLTPRGNRLQADLTGLQKAVTLAQTPVEVVLASDQLTEVAVYRIGRLGRFESHTLQLRPGTYTVVGSRDGFQDVRQTLRVEAGQEGPLQLTVICRIKV